MNLTHVSDFFCTLLHIVQDFNLYVILMQKINTIN